MSNSKDPIKLRKRLTSSGLTSLYLDIYIDGKRSYEYLKLYLVPEKFYMGVSVKPTIV